MYRKGRAARYLHLNPRGMYQEDEGTTLIITKDSADNNDLSCKTTYKQITLIVHSSLDAVGLTTAVSAKLADNNISPNVVAAYFHDHIFVQSAKAEQTLAAIKELGKQHNRN